LRQESAERTERHDRVIESLRHKHKTQIEQKSDEISELSRKLSDSVDAAERMRMDRDGVKEELSRL